MTCLCGRRFSWSEARPPVACRHHHSEGWWGRSCPHCSRAAKAELMARRAAVGTVIAPAYAIGGAAAVGVGTAVAAAAIPIAAAVAVVPAAVCGPLALVTEPFRRMAGAKGENPFGGAAVAGAKVAGAALFLPLILLIGYESD